MKIYKYFLLTLIIVLTDQIVKLSVYFFMEMGPSGEIPLVGHLFKLHYTLNPGMAFGLELGSSYGKFLLSGFRILAVFAIAYYLRDMILKNTSSGLLWCVAAILGGAIGNVIDSTFYGVLLHNAPYGSPTAWFHGQVIDMFYIDIWEGYLPDWLPLIGGQYYAFWPIFNVADASIFISVITLLLFQKRFFAEPVAETPADQDVKSQINNS